MLKSKLSFKAYIMLGAMALFPMGMIFLIGFAFTQPQDLQWILLPVAISTLIPTYLVYRMLRNQMATISIGYGHIKKKPLFGYEEDFRLQEFQHFITLKQRDKSGIYEILHLIKQDKRIVTISEMFHSNYTALKTEIVKTVPDAGEVRYRLFAEVRELFN